MADSATRVDTLIADLVAYIEERERPITDDKRTVNRMCERAGLALRYPNIEGANSGGGFVFRSDQFYGKGLATAIKEYLTMRGPSNRGGRGAANVNEIYDALVSGGFKFETKDNNNAKRGLRIALTKNSVTFHRVPNQGPGGDAYGLLEWYPNAKPEKQTDDVSEKETVAEPAAMKATSGKNAKKGTEKEPGKRRGRPPNKKAASPDTVKSDHESKTATSDDTPVAA